MRATRHPARPLIGGAALIFLAACANNPPESGFAPPPPAPVIAPTVTPTYDAAREAQLRGEAAGIAAEARAALDAPSSAAAGLSTGVDAPLAGPAADRVPAGAPIEIEGSATPIDSSTGALPPPMIPGGPIGPAGSFSATTDPVQLGLDRDNPAISNEQDFRAVSAARDIEDDAARLRAARAQYQSVEPTELRRPDGSGSNVISYALNGARPVGSAGSYSRGTFASERRAASRCNGYRTPDVAQEAFLSAGGPQSDRLGLDPDGDGNACGWNPATYANLVRQ